MAQLEYNILTRRDTAADWTTTNPVLGSGELGYETDTGRYKTGDGSTPWNSLGYQIVTQADKGIANGVVPLDNNAKIPGIYIDVAGDASTISYTPYGSISATDVQGAIDELHDDIPNKVGEATNLTGIVSGGEVTLNIDGTKIDISPCVYYIQGVRYTYAGGTGLSSNIAVSQSSRRFGLDSTGLVHQQGEFSDTQKRTILPIARVQAVQGQTGPGSNLIAPVDTRYLVSEFGYIDRVWREAVFGVLYPETGGTYSESATPRQVNQASGFFYDAQGKKQIIQATTNITAKYVYHTGGVWTVATDAVLVINNSQYDNGTNLTTLTNNYWVAHTLLRSPKSPNEFFLVVGQSEHSTQTEAEAEPAQFGPFVSESTSSLVAVAKFVIRKDSANINRIVNIQPRIKGPENEATGVSALLPSVSNPTEVTNYEDAFRVFNSSSIVSGCVATDNGNGTFSIGSGEIIIRSSNSDIAPLAVYAVGASGTLTPVDNDVTYYFLDYNNGVPVWSSGNTIASYNGTDKVQGYTVSRRGNSLWIIDTRGQAIDGNRKIRRRDLEWSGNTQQGFWHTVGGTVIGSSGLALTLTAGKFYYGVAPVTHPSFDTSVAGTANANVFDYYYNRTTYTYTANSKTISNTQYDNAGVLTAMAPGRYRTDWVYLVLDGATPRLIVIFGNAEYTTLAAAQADPIPTVIPAFMQGSSVLVGRATVLNGGTTLSTATAFGSAFNQATSSVHNNLSGLQGGTTNDYQHLTSAEYTGTGTGVFVRNTSPTIATPTFTGSATVNANTASAALSVTQLGSGDLFEIKDEDPDSTPFKIDSTGRVLLGATSTSAGAGLQIYGSSNLCNSFHFRYANDSGSAGTSFRKTRGTSTTDFTIVQSGDTLGDISFQGADGASLIEAANIRSYVDGPPGTNDMPGRLVLSTTADGASTPTERLRITSAGKSIFSSSGSTLTFGQSNIPTVQVNTIDANGIGVSRWTANTAGSFLQLAKSRGSSIASRAVVSSGDTLGTVTFDADDGTNFITGAQILAQVDGTPGTNDMPSRLVFSTTADGASAPVERMRIDSTGKMTNYAQHIIESAAGTGNLLIRNGNADATIKNGSIVATHYTNAEEPLGVLLTETTATENTIYMGGGLSVHNAATSLRFVTGANNTTVSGTERMRIDSAGRVGIGAVPNTGEVLNVSKNPEGDGSGIAFSIRNYGTIQSSVSNTYYGNLCNVNTAASSFTLPLLEYFTASQGTFGVGSSVTTQIGFGARANLIGATNNYGFHSNLPAGTGRWNFYAAGTADNYFAGRVAIGTTSTPSILTVKGTWQASEGIFQIDANSGEQFSGMTIQNNGTALTYLYGDNVNNITFLGSTSGRSLVFATNTGGTDGERMRIGSDGLITIASGQIKFPAVQNASADANTLDDYEEGTWTPSLGGTATYTSRAGTYTKVGRQVTVTFSITVNVLGTGDSGTISGLPFTAAGDIGTGMVGYYNSVAGSYGGAGIGFFTSGTTLRNFVNGATTSSVDRAIFQNGTRIDGASITYFTT